MAFTCWWQSTAVLDLRPTPKEGNNFCYYKLNQFLGASEGMNLRKEFATASFFTTL